MARTKTLTQIRDRIRSLGEIRSIYVSDDQLREEINQSIAELYDKLVASSQDYYEDEQLINVVAGTASYALPSDYYKTIGVDVKRSDNSYQSLRKYNISERNNYDIYGTAGVNREWSLYRVRGGNLTIIPEPNWTEVEGIKHIYIPTPPSLTNADDTFDGIAGWEDWVVYDCCVKIIGGKEEGDASQFERLLGKLNSRIENMATHRDVGNPDSIRDTDVEDRQRMWPRSTSA